MAGICRIWCIGFARGLKPLEPLKFECFMCGKKCPCKVSYIQDMNSYQVLQHVDKTFSLLMKTFLRCLLF